MRVHAVSDATKKEGVASLSRDCWASGRSWPKRGTARARRQWATGKEEATRAAVKELGFRAESEEKGKFLFLFPFQIFQSIFK
jgi:hypothetical protein